MFRTVRRWFFLALFGAPAAAWAASDMSSLPPLHTLTSEQPVVICRQFPAEQIERLKSGDKQLVLVVEHYQPPRNASAGLYVAAPNRASRSPRRADRDLSRPAFRQRAATLPAAPSEYAGAVQADRVCLSVGFYRETNSRVAAKPASASTWSMRALTGTPSLDTLARPYPHAAARQGYAVCRFTKKQRGTEAHQHAAEEPACHAAHADCETAAARAMPAARSRA